MKRDRGRLHIGIDWEPDDTGPAPMASVPVGPERQLRIDLRALLNQGNGTWIVSNIIADDIAMILLRNMRQAGYLREES